MNSKTIDLTEILLKWDSLPIEKKTSMRDTLDKHLATRKSLQNEEKTLSMKMMEYDKAFFAWLNSWTNDDQPAQ